MNEFQGESVRGPIIAACAADHDRNQSPPIALGCLLSCCSQPGKDLPVKANGPVSGRAIPMKGGDAHGPPQQAVLDSGARARRLSTGLRTRSSMHRNLAAD